MKNSISIKKAKSTEDFLVAKALIFEYVEWLGYDLSFQNFDNEINTLSSIYGFPNGCLFVAFKNKKAIGIAGIKRFSNEDCELKRMFVQPTSRGFGIGNLLLVKCIKMAKKLNYQTIKLDTADFMKPAIKLYTNNGFVEISSYTHNPYEEARYFELDLSKAWLIKKAHLNSGLFVLYKSIFN